jgi:hypothetical protein
VLLIGIIGFLIDSLIAYAIHHTRWTTCQMTTC